MQKQMSSEGLLIVVELGAEWPSLSGAEAARVSSRRVLAQDETETPAAFAVRVGEQLGALFARGMALGSAVLACSERIDVAALSARAEVARVAAGVLARARGGSVSLVASDRNEGRSRAPLTALREELAREWLSAGIDVKLYFGDEASAAVAEPKSRTGSKRSRPKDGARRVA